MTAASLLDLDKVTVPVRKKSQHRTASLLDNSTGETATAKGLRPASVASLADLDAWAILLEQRKRETKDNPDIQQHRIECGICFRPFVGQYKSKYCSKACVLESRRLKRAKLPFPNRPAPIPEDPEGWKDGLSEEDYRCPSEGARKVEIYLRSRHDCLDLETEKSFLTCKSKALLRFDFAIPSLRVLIEYHGEQHYKAVSIWGGEEGLAVRQKRNIMKRNWANRNGWRLIEVPYHVGDIPSYLNKRLREPS